MAQQRRVRRHGTGARRCWAERGYVPGMYSMICPRLELLEGPMAVLLWYRIELEEGASCSCGVQGARCEVQRRSGAGSW